MIMASTITSANSTATPTIGHSFTNHGDPNLYCLPARTLDVLIFFFLNYLTHAATLKTIPGESGVRVVFDVLAALFFPTSGVYRGLDAIFSAAKFADTDLETAARAGALCAVVPWSPTRETGDPLKPADRLLEPIWPVLETKVHGSYQLPVGYALAILPRDAKFVNDFGERKGFWRKLTDGFRYQNHQNTTITSSYNVVKSIVAAVQLLYGCATLYSSHNSEVDLYGFTAFGLTVAPYAWMSFVNLVANMICPEYPTVYLVESETMRSLQTDPKYHDTVLFSGIVGKLTARSDREMMQSIERLTASLSSGEPKKALNKTKLKRLSRMTCYALVATVVPIIIIGAFSHFRRGRASSDAQVVVISLWLLYGLYFGVLGVVLVTAFEDRPILNFWAIRKGSKRQRWLIGLTFLFGSNAILAAVEVAKMILNYGVCMPIN